MDDDVIVDMLTHLPNDLTGFRKSEQWSAACLFHHLGLYWCVTAMDIMGRLDRLHKPEIVAFINGITSDLWLLRNFEYNILCCLSVYS